MRYRLTAGIVAMMLVMLMLRPALVFAEDEHAFSSFGQQSESEIWCGCDDFCVCGHRCLCGELCGCAEYECVECECAECECDECECTECECTECECAKCECAECECGYWEEPWPQCECDDYDGLVCCFYKLHEEAGMGAEELELGADIVIPFDKWLHLEDIRIGTGRYSLITEGYLYLWQGADIYGSGIDGAVVQVEDGGSLNIFNTQYNGTAAISATETGGVALSLSSGSGHYSDESAYVVITAEDGIGILSEIPLELICHYINAGSGSGIVSTEDVSLFLCRVEGETAAVDAPAVFADTSVIVPQDGDGIETVHRRIKSVFPSLAVLDIGDPQPEELFADSYYTTVTYSAQGVEDRELLQFVRADIPQIDTSVPGDWLAFPVIEDWMELSGLLPIEEELYAIAVRDLRVPVYWYIDAVFDPSYVFYRYNGAESDPLILWRSDDEGESWQDATDSYDFMLWDEGTLVLIQWVEDDPVWLVWETPDAGESEILVISFSAGTAYGNPGGDRSGIDRGETKLPDNGSQQGAHNNEQPPSGEGLPPMGDDRSPPVSENTPPQDGQITMPPYEPGNELDDASMPLINPPLSANPPHPGIEADDLIFDSWDALPPLSTFPDNQGTEIFTDQPDNTHDTIITTPLVPAQSLPAMEEAHPFVPFQPDLLANNTSAASSAYRDSFTPIIIAGVLGLVMAIAYLVFSAKKREV